MLATIDLLNGMQSKPGTFVRRGHDYRIDLREGAQQAFGLTCTAEQAEAIEVALREREQEWATRRMVARKIDTARRAIQRQLAEWGSPSHRPRRPRSRGDPGAFESGRLSRLAMLAAPRRLTRPASA